MSLGECLTAASSANVIETSRADPKLGLLPPPGTARHGERVVETAGSALAVGEWTEWDYESTGYHGSGTAEPLTEYDAFAFDYEFDLR